MKALIIGYGSIGKRHFDILKHISIVSHIEIVTKQIINGVKSYKNLEDVNLIEFDYFVISSETYKHYNQLKYICQKVANKIILVEKPLFDRCYDVIDVNGNTIFTAYNLRFNPVLLTLKNMLVNERVYYVNAYCGQYLPSWRKGTDYRNSYSADLKKGGGVLRDLSHEIDYVTWLFGKFDSSKVINTKISDLEINSDDIFTGIGVTSDKSIVSITVDYISKITARRILVHTENFTFDVDLIAGKIIMGDKTGVSKEIVIKNEGRNITYLRMHEAALKKDSDVLCSFEDGYNIVEYIAGTKMEKINE